MGLRGRACDHLHQPPPLLIAESGQHRQQDVVGGFGVAGYWLGLGGQTQVARAVRNPATLAGTRSPVETGSKPASSTTPAMAVPMNILIARSSSALPNSACRSSAALSGPLDRVPPPAGAIGPDERYTACGGVLDGHQVPIEATALATWSRLARRCRCKMAAAGPQQGRQARCRHPQVPSARTNSSDFLSGVPKRSRRLSDNGAGVRAKVFVNSAGVS